MPQTSPVLALMVELLYTHRHTHHFNVVGAAFRIVFHVPNTTEIYAYNNNFSLNNTSHTYRKGLSTTYTK